MSLRVPFLRRGHRADRVRLQIEQLRAELRGHLAAADRLLARERTALLTQLEVLDGQVAAGTRSATPVELAGWADARWRSWSPGSGRFDLLRLGEIGAGPTAGLPIGIDGTTLVMVSRTAETRELADSILTSLTLRAATAAPQQTRFVFVDASRDGVAFSSLRRLDRTTATFGDPRRAIEQLAGDIARIEATYLGQQQRRLSEVPLARRLGEGPRFVAISSFPHGFDPFSTEAVVDLTTRAPACAIQLVVHLDLETVPDLDGLIARFEAADVAVLDLDSDPPHPALGAVALDAAPPGEVQQMVLQRVRAARPADETVDWDTVEHPGEAAWGQLPAVERLVAPIAVVGGEAPMEVSFGIDPATGARTGHGVVVGGTAAARHDLYDVLLAGLVVRHSPDQLRVELLGGSGPATFDGWRELPHLDLLGIRPTVLHTAEAIRAIRKETDRRLTSSLRRPVRKLAIVDGIDEVLGSDGTEVIDDLRLILERGHEVGVHLLLGARRFRDLGPLHRASLFDLVDLRIALEPAADDALGREEFGARGGRLVQRVCDRRYRAVVNAFGGADDATVAAQLLTLDAARREQIVRRVVSLTSSPRDAAVVLDGSRTPDFADSALLGVLARCEAEARGAGTRELALRGTPAGGIGLEEWDPSDGPRLVVLGRAEALAGETAIVLKRRPTENTVVVSSRPSMLVSAGLATATGAFLSAAPAATEIEVLDAARGAVGPPDTLSHGLATLARCGAKVTVRSSEEQIVEAIRSVADEITHRRAVGQDALAGLPARVVIVRAPDRVRPLGRVPTSDGRADSELGLVLRSIIATGPAVGIHTTLLASSLTALRVVVADEVVQQEFRHRLIDRLPVEDSFVLIRSGAAAELVGSGEVAPALLFDGHLHTVRRYLPFDADGGSTTIGERLAELLGAPGAGGHG